MVISPGSAREGGTLRRDRVCVRVIDVRLGFLVRAVSSLEVPWDDRNAKPPVPKPESLFDGSPLKCGTICNNGCQQGSRSPKPVVAGDAFPARHATPTPMPTSCLVALARIECGFQLTNGVSRCSCIQLRTQLQRNAALHSHYSVASIGGKSASYRTALRDSARERKRGPKMQLLPSTPVLRSRDKRVGSSSRAPVDA